MNDPVPPLPGRSPVAGKNVVVKFDGGRLSSDGGILTLREIGGRLRVAERMAGCIGDPRASNHVTHSMADIIRFCLLMIAAGYEDGIEAVRRIDELFEIERAINGKPPDERKASRQAQSKSRVEALEAWLRQQRALVSAKSEIARAINYSLNQWRALTRFLDDGRICLSNNAAERGLKGAAIGRVNRMFAGSDEGARRAAAVYTLIETCKLNDVDPKAWLAQVLAKLPDHPAKRIDELLPWNWKAAQKQATHDSVIHQAA